MPPQTSRLTSAARAELRRRDAQTEAILAQIAQGGSGRPMASHAIRRPGNVDLYGQPEVPNPDGTTSTVDSIGVNIDNLEYLLPTVTTEGRHFANEASAQGVTDIPRAVRDMAVDEFRRTGRHLGAFNSVEEANAEAEKLHDDYARGKYRVRPMPSHTTPSPDAYQGDLNDVLPGGRDAAMRPPTEFEILRGADSAPSLRDILLPGQPEVADPTDAQRAAHEARVRDTQADWGPVRRGVARAAEFAGEHVPEFLGGALWGDPTDPDASRANLLGQMLTAGVPLAGGIKRAVSTAGRAVVRPPVALSGHLAEAVGDRSMPRGLGSLGRTLEMSGGDVRLKQEVVDRLATFHDIGGRLPITANWSGANNADLLDAFGGDVAAARAYAMLWGATSPNTKVGRNTIESLVAQAYRVSHSGDPIPLSVAQSLDPTSGRQLITSAGSKALNIRRAATGEELSGPKVREMGSFMAGEPSTPIDRHMMYAAGSKQSKLDLDLPAVKAWLGGKLGLPRSGRGSLDDQQVYDVYASTIADALHGINSGAGHNMNFGKMWEGTKAWKGQKSEGAPIDILRDMGLLSKGSMLDAKKLREALLRAGVALPWAGALLAAIHESPDEGL